MHPMQGFGDENAHQRYAYAVVTGQLPVGQDMMVQVPDVLTAEGPECWRFQATEPATCAIAADPMSARGSEHVEAVTQAANYPPLYYYLVGTPLLLTDLGVPGPVAVHLSRLLSCLVFSALVAAGVVALRGRAGTLAGMLAATWFVLPSTLTSAAAINPQSLEIGAALLLAGAAWPLLRPGTLPGPRLVLMGIASAVLIQSRPVGAMWAVAIAVLLAIALGPRFLTVVRNRGFLAFLGLSVVSSILWILQRRLWPHPNPYDSTHGLTDCDLGCSTEDLVARFPGFLIRSIGMTGWDDVFVPVGLAWVTLGVLVVLFVLALVLGPWRVRIALALGLLLLPGSAVLIQGSTVDVSGYMWQARYALPLLLPLIWLASQTVAEGLRLSTASRRRVLGIGTLGVAVVMTAVVIGFVVHAARRFWVGLGRPGSLLESMPLTATAGVVVVIVTALLGLACTILLLAPGIDRSGPEDADRDARSGRSRTRPRDPGDPHGRRASRPLRPRPPASPRPGALDLAPRSAIAP